MWYLLKVYALFGMGTVLLILTAYAGVLSLFYAFGATRRFASGVPLLPAAIRTHWPLSPRHSGRRNPFL